MSREEFLDSSPRELEAFFRRLEVCRDEIRFGPALVTAAIYNVYRDPDKCPVPFEPFDFMPGKPRRRHDSVVTQDFIDETIANNWQHIPTEDDKRYAADFVTALQAQINPKMLIIEERER